MKIEIVHEYVSDMRRLLQTLIDAKTAQEARFIATTIARCSHDFGSKVYVEGRLEDLFGRKFLVVDNLVAATLAAEHFGDNSKCDNFTTGDAIQATHALDALCAALGWQPCAGRE